MNDFENNPMNNKSIRHDLYLILIGGFISLTSVVATGFVNFYINQKTEDRRVAEEHRKELLAEKIKFNNELIVDVGQGLSAFRKYASSSALNDTTRFMDGQKEAFLYIDKMNSRLPYYEALLQFYYGDTLYGEFADKIYSPLLKIFVRLRLNQNLVNSKDPTLFLSIDSIQTSFRSLVCEMNISSHK